MMIERDLVYDVGSNDGSDTAYYLAKGFRVVAVEADPLLAERLVKCFAGDIARGRLTVLNVGVAERAGEATFYRSGASGLSSFDQQLAMRGNMPACPIRVTCERFDVLLASHGLPQYLKVDIEGMDHLCVLALDCVRRPPFVSFEAGDRTVELVRHLDRIGYTRFRLVGQNPNRILQLPPIGSIAHPAWAARQWVRHTLRGHPLLHGPLKRWRARRAYSRRRATAAKLLANPIATAGES